jgi:hypothetical protein
MKLWVNLLDRAFGTPLAPPDVQFEINQYSWAALGGPEQASLTAYGPAMALWELLEWLRAPVEIIDERGQAAWWGYVAEVTVRVGAVEVGLSLETMSNAVAVAYSLAAAGSSGAGVRATTGWGEDSRSSGVYGRREMLGSLSAATDAQAAAYRDALLGRAKYPTPTVKVTPGQDSLSATLRCRGWWDTLGWRYYTNLAGIEAYETGGAIQNVGEGSGIERVAQSFQLGNAVTWEAESVQMLLNRTSIAPTDNVTLTVAADATGVPGTTLASASLAASGLTETQSWVNFTLNQPVTLQPATTYWLVIGRSGANAADNFYQVGVDTNLGYGRGVGRMYIHSAWQQLSVDGDLPFRVLGTQETTAQAAYLATAVGQFLTGVTVVNASGIWSSQYRDGDATGLKVLQELLATGTVNGRRLLATVTQARKLQIYEEPANDPTQTPLLVRSDGQVEDRWGRMMLAHTCPAAQWCTLKDVIPPTLNMTAMNDPTRWFVERSEFNVTRQALTLEPRGVGSPWSATQVGMG